MHEGVTKKKSEAEDQGADGRFWRPFHPNQPRFIDYTMELGRLYSHSRDQSAAESGQPRGR